MLNKVAAIIVAAGSSQRMGLDKIFLKLLGKETVLYSLEAFEKNSMINEIILVVSDISMDRAKTLCGKNFKKLKITVAGGKNRSESVLNGIKAVSEDCEYIIIHDGARPLINDKIISDCIENVKKYKATTVAVPVIDTVKEISHNIIVNTPERSRLAAVQTPQAFDKKIYLECAEKLKGKSFTDDCQLFEQCNIEVFITRGDYKNIKLTNPIDIKMAELLLREENKN